MARSDNGPWPKKDSYQSINSIVDSDVECCARRASLQGGACSAVLVVTGADVCAAAVFPGVEVPTDYTHSLHYLGAAGEIPTWRCMATQVHV